METPYRKVVHAVPNNPDELLGVRAAGARVDPSR